MTSFMNRLCAAIVRYRAVVIGIWVVLLLAAAPFALQQKDVLSGGGFNAVGSESDQVDNIVAEKFPTSVPGLAVVVEPLPGALPPPGAAGRVLESAAGELRGVPGVSIDPKAVRDATDTLTQGRTAILPVVVASQPGSGPDAVAANGKRALGIVDQRPTVLPEGYRLMLTGAGAINDDYQQEIISAAARAEVIGVPILLAVLLLAFGSVVATLLPLLLGGMCVGLTLGVIYFIAVATPMSAQTSNTVSMIGLAVAVDYSLFVVSRYRAERRAGREHYESLRISLATSGTASVYSGLTVIASTAGILLIGSMALNSMGIGAMLVVAISILGTATLLPALIHFTRRSRGWTVQPRWSPDTDRVDAFWKRWTHKVMSRPVRSVLLSGGLLVVMALPALALHIQYSPLGQLPAGNQSRLGVEAAERDLGPGALTPILITVQGEDGAPPPKSAVDGVGLALLGEPDVRISAVPQTSPDGGTVLYQAIPRSDGDSDTARDVVALLRDDLTDVDPGAVVMVGGSTGVISDFDRMVQGAMPEVIAFVLALAMVILLVVLRAPLLALKAVLMNVLTVLAAYGVLVMVFQWGWLSFLGLEPAPAIDTAIPALLLVVSFGLSMDYEVFLLGRIRERWLATGDNRRSVAEGVASSARTITSAALVMVAVFLAFGAGGLPAIERLGGGCAVAVALDATVVRLVLVPAAMQLLGRWNWWTPSFGSRRRRRPAPAPAAPAPERELATSSAGAGED